MGRERRFIGHVGVSGVGIRDGMGMGWDGQHKYHCGIAVPSHPIQSPFHMPVPFNPMTTLGNNREKVDNMQQRNKMVGRGFKRGHKSKERGVRKICIGYILRQDGRSVLRLERE